MNPAAKTEAGPRGGGRGRGGRIDDDVTASRLRSLATAHPDSDVALEKETAGIFGWIGRSRRSAGVRPPSPSSWFPKSEQNKPSLKEVSQILDGITGGGGTSRCQWDRELFREDEEGGVSGSEPIRMKMDGKDEATQRPEQGGGHESKTAAPGGQTDELLIKEGQGGCNTDKGATGATGATGALTIHLQLARHRPTGPGTPHRSPEQDRESHGGDSGDCWNEEGGGCSPPL